MSRNPLENLILPDHIAVNTGPSQKDMIYELARTIVITEQIAQALSLTPVDPALGSLCVRGSGDRWYALMDIIGGIFAQLHFHLEDEEETL